jgi:ABC-type multidrug transport system ATPase subunit
VWVNFYGAFLVWRSFCCAQDAREGRILILTTHFMDEADLLGDRIVIMSHVRAVCPGCGTHVFCDGWRVLRG